MVSPSDYDALADLFLAGGGLSHDAGVSQSVTAGAAKGGTPSSFTIAAPLSNAFRGPAVAIDASHAPLDLPRRTQAAFIEGIIIGHLPVFAAGWVTQYAKRLSEERQEPVTLIRAHGGRCEMDLVGSLASLSADTPASGIAGAMAVAAPLSNSWIIRVDEPNETSLATLDGLDRLTLLTGADDVALAATYRTLKFLVAKLRASSADLDGEALGDRLRVMVMGATDEKALTAQEKLRGMLGAFLDAPLDIAVGPQRVSPTLMSSLFRDAVQHEPAELVSMIRTLPRETGTPSSRIGPVRTSPPPRGSSAVSPAEPLEIHANRSPAIEPKPTRAPVTASVAPIPAREPWSGMPRSASHALELVHHIPGLSKLPVSCPYIPEAEIGADARGGLHLLARAGDEHSAGDTVSRLMSAAGWLHDHLPLIRLALPQTPLAPSADDVELHLFTDQPKAVRRLLDGGVKIHLLASVQVGGAVAWVCRELN